MKHLCVKVLWLRNTELKGEQFSVISFFLKKTFPKGKNPSLFVPFFVCVCVSVWVVHTVDRHNQSWAFVPLKNVYFRTFFFPLSLVVVVVVVVVVVIDVEKSVT